MHVEWVTVTVVIVLVLGVMRWMTKVVFNPFEMNRAGRPGAPDPGIRPADDGFVVALPYDTRPDWATNVVAAGSARLEKDHRRMGAITSCLRLRAAGAS